MTCQRKDETRTDVKAQRLTILLMKVECHEPTYWIGFNHPCTPRMSADGFTHYAVLPGYLIP